MAALTRDVTDGIDLSEITQVSSVELDVLTDGILISDTISINRTLLLADGSSLSESFEKLYQYGTAGFNASFLTWTQKST